MGVRVPPSAQHITLNHNQATDLVIEGFLYVPHINSAELDISLNTPSTTEGKIKVTLLPTDYQPAVDEKVTEYRKKAQLKGFRPGKVPASVIKKMYGKSILVEEINKVVSSALTSYIRDNNLNVVGEPLPDEESIKELTWEENQEYEFVYDIGLYSDFEVSLDKISGITSYDIEVKDKEVDDMVEDLRKQHGTSTNPEEAAAEDSLYGTITSNSDAELNETGLLDISTLPKKEQKAFIGAKPEDVISFVIEKAFPEAGKRASFLGKTEEEVAELTGEFTLTVKNVNHQEPAELNQEFFEKFFGPDSVTTEEEFREKIRESLGSNYNSEAKGYLQVQVRDAIVEQTSIELPNDFLKGWLLKSSEQDLTKEQIEAEFPNYVKDLKWSLITQQLAKENDVNVEHEDVLEQARKLIRSQFGAQGMGAMPQLEENIDSFANNYLQGENGDNYMRVFNQVRGQRIMDISLEQVKTKSKKVSPDMFREIVAN